MRLNKDTALAALVRLDQALAPADLADLRKIVAALDANTLDTSVVMVLAHLYPAKGLDAANKAFERLRSRLVDAVESAGLALELSVRGAKKLGGERRVSFEGEVPIAATADMREIEEVTARGALIDQEAAPVPPVVVILTVNDNEVGGLLDAFVGGSNRPPQAERNGRPYNDLGSVGRFRVVHAHCEMGGLGSQARALQVIADWHPEAVLAVGVGFGVDSKRQRLGDVLVASQVIGYDLQRVNADGTRILREPRPPASERWLHRVRHTGALGQRGGSWPTVRVGPLLSGQTLVDNRKLRDQLVAETGGEAIGGEMEGLGLARACWGDRPTHWLLVKGIADFADGKKPKGEAKQRIQRDAAFRAAWLARWTIDGGVPEPLPAAASMTGVAVVPSDARTRRLVLFSPAAETPDFDATRALGAVLENPAERTTLDAQRLGEERAARQQERGTPALALLRGWLADPDGPAYFAVLGEYGMGKTIVCQRLTRELELERKTSPGLVPLYFDLKKVTGLRTPHVDPSTATTTVERVPTLDDVLRECIERGWRAESGVAKPSTAEVHRAVEQGALVIFDGLDEVLVHLSDAGGQQLTDALLRILPPREPGKEKASPSRVLVSCRTHFFRSLREQRANLLERGRSDRSAEGFGALLLLPFNDEQVEQYLRSALPELDVERAMATIRAVHNLSELVARPYLLRQIGRLLPRIEQWRAEGRKVQGVTLYREIARDWLDRDLGKTHLKPEHKLALAADLAAELWRRGQRLLPAGELESWFHAWRDAQVDRSRRYDWIDRAKLEEDLRNSHFLVREDGASERESGFRFAHSSMAELFLAEHLLQAVREDRPERWAVAVPSAETLEFLGQMLVEEPTDELVRRLGTWRAPYRPQASELLLAFAFDCYRKGRPTPVLRGADLGGVRLPGWDLSAKPKAAQPRLDLSGARFDDANLRETVFAGLRLEGASFAGARMERAELHDCRLERAVFARARLHGAILRRCNIRDAAWSGAALYRTAILRPTAGETVAGMLPAPDPYRQAPGARRLALFRGHSRGVRSCAFSPDGALIVSGGDDGVLRTWDAASGEARAELRGHAGVVKSCAFSPDGASIVSGGGNGVLRTWDASGEARSELKGHTGVVFSCGFTPDGAVIVTGDSDGVMRLWDAASGEARVELRGHAGAVYSCGFSPDAATIVSGGSDGVMRLWDAASGEARAELRGHTGVVFSCGFSPDGAVIVSGGSDRIVRLWDAASGEVRAELKGHTAWVASCAFSPDGEAIVSGGDDGMVRVWDAAVGEARTELKGHSGGVTSCAFSPDGTAIVTGDSSGAVRLWDASSGEALAELRGRTEWVTSCALSPDGAAFVSGGADGTSRLWDAATGELRPKWKSSMLRAFSYALSPDGEAIASGGLDGTVRLWDATSGEVRVELRGHTGWVTACAFSPDGGATLTGGDDGTLRLWGARFGEARAELKGHTDWIRSCGFSPDGTAIVSGGDDGTVRLWDAASGEARAVMKDQIDGVRSCAFSPDGAAIVSGGDDGTVRLWDVASGDLRAELKGHRGWVTSCAFSPSGAVIVSGGYDGTVRLWDAVSGTAITVWQVNAGEVLSCAFLPNGTTIVAAGSDGITKFRNAASGALLRVLYQREGGSAAWDPRTNRLLHASGEVWRDLRWVVPTADGGFDTLPLETFGDIVEDWSDRDQLC